MADKELEQLLEKLLPCKYPEYCSESGHFTSPVCPASFQQMLLTELLPYTRRPPLSLFDQVVAALMLVGDTSHTELLTEVVAWRGY
jgi:hypothetical protein